MLKIIICSIFSLIAFNCLSQSLPSETFPLFTERLAFSKDSLVTAEKGYLFVPANRQKDNNSVIAIEFFRFRRKASADPNTPPIFRLFGGPGFPGVEASFSQPGFYENSIAPFLAVSDFIIVNQRGIGTSMPNTICESRKVLDSLINKEAVYKTYKEACLACKDYWQDKIDLQGLNIIEAAADVDDVRKSLDYDKIMLWGGSFGSHWAMAVMRYHPQIVARALLRGLEGPNHTYDVPDYIFNSLERIAAAVDSSQALEKWVPEKGILYALKNVIDRLDKEPVYEEINKGQKLVIDADLVREYSLGVTARASARKDMVTWPADILKLYHQDYEDIIAKANKDRTVVPIPSASFFMLDCASGITEERYAQIKNDPVEYLLGNINDSYDLGCPVWQIDLGDDFRQNFITDIPTLMVHGTWDLSTPIENAWELKPFFKNSHLVTVEGGSHDSLLEAMLSYEEFHQQVLQFFKTGKMDSLPDKVVLPSIDWQIPQNLQLKN